MQAGILTFGRRRPHIGRISAESPPVPQAERPTTPKRPVLGAPAVVDSLIGKPLAPTLHPVCRSRYGTTKTMFVPVRNGLRACPRTVPLAVTKGLWGRGSR